MGITVRSGVTIIDSGIPAGGTTGQALIKASGEDYDVTWGAGGGGGTPGGSSGQMQWNNAGSFAGAAFSTVATSGTHLRLTAQAATDIPFAVRGATSQTANLQQWENSAGTAVTSISSAGAIISQAGAALGNGSFAVNNGLNTILYNSAIFGWSSTSTVGVTTTTFDTALRRNAAGILEVNNGTAGQWRSLRVGAASAATIAMVVRAAASQTANLQQWENSGGTALASISSAGNLTAQLGSFTGAGAVLSIVRTGFTNFTLGDANGDTFRIQNGGDTTDMLRIHGATKLATFYGGITPASMSDASAANSTLYYSTTASKLVYKDAGGTVNALY